MMQGALPILCIMLLASPLAAQQVPEDLTVMPPVPSGYEPPRTSWGDPDFRGTYPIDDIARIPFERPAAFGDRFWLTEAEFAERQSLVDAQERNYANESGSDSIGQGHWLSANVSGRRTSLLVSPVDGRLPALTTDGEARYRAGRSSWSWTRRRSGPW